MLTVIHSIPNLRLVWRYRKSHAYFSSFVPYSPLLVFSNFIVQIILPEQTNPSWALSKIHFAVFANSPSVTHSSIGHRSKTFFFGSQTGTGMFQHRGERRGAKDVVRAQEAVGTESFYGWGAGWEGHFHVVGAEEVYEKGGAIKVGGGE